LAGLDMLLHLIRASMRYVSWHECTKAAAAMWLSTLRK
jgi:hypothetical protein